MTNFVVSVLPAPDSPEMSTAWSATGFSSAAADAPSRSARRMDR